MTSGQFNARYPEFSTVDSTLVSAVLTEVGFGLDPTIYGLRFDAAHGALSAHRLWLSPAGVSLRGDSTQTDTSDYLKQFQQIRREVTIGFAVIT